MSAVTRWCIVSIPLTLGLLFSAAFAQQDSAEVPKEYQFTDVHRVDCTDVKSQDRTGTCWCYASASFFESELLRQGKPAPDLSEMFIARALYLEKARIYLLRQGKTNFGEGAMTHDFLTTAQRNGLVPEEVYNGLLDGAQVHDHGEMQSVLLAVMDAYIKQRQPSGRWDDVIGAVLDIYLGSAPSEFNYEGKSYTPQSFADNLGFNAKDYVGLTSYTHHPFNDTFVLEVPDNFSGGAFLNVPIDQLVATIDRAIENGYSVAWDGDVSERGFIMNKGVAVLPDDSNRQFADQPGSETTVTQEMRQATFENYSTGEEHLMHLVGIAKDQLGNKYYVIKNSWGPIGSYSGYLYMSENYVRLKTVCITVHRDVLEMTAQEATETTAAGGTTDSSGG